MSQAVSSTSPGNSPSASPSASQSNPTGNLSGNAQPDPIRDFVRSAAVHIRRTELYYGWMTWLSVLLFTLTAFVLVDHWLLEMSRWMRIAIFGALAVWSVAWFVRKIVPPMFYRINPEHAARLIEKQIPDSKDSLISWLQLNEVSATPPKSVLNQIGRYAFKFLRSADATQVADTANLVRLSAAFFGCLLCIAIYFFASPKSGWTSVSRLLLPWANIAPATRVQFVQITPKATTVMQGSTLPVDVTLRGLHKNEKVQLQYDLSDGQVQGEVVPFREEIHGVHYKLDLGKSFGGIHQPLTYWIIAGDAKAGPYQVDIQVVPLVAIDQIELVYPPYTKLKSRTLIQQGQLEVPEGTVASITALANQEMQKGRLEFDPVLQGKSLLSVGETVEMVVDANKLTANWIAKVDPKNRKKRESTYRVKATNSLNEANHDPVIYPVKVIPDLPPEAEFGNGIVGPIDLPVNESVSIEVHAIDPDYGLTQVAVLGLGENRLRPSEPKQLFAETLFEATEDEPLKRNFDFVLKPESMSLQPGDVFDLVVVAKDNYHLPGSQEFSPQVAQSSPLRVRIVEASRQGGQDGNAEPSNQPNPNEATPATEPGAIANSKPKTEKIDWNKVPQNNPRDPGKSNRTGRDSNSPQDDAGIENQNPQQQAQDPGIGSGGESGNQASKKQDDSMRNRNGQQQSGGGGGSSEDSESQNPGQGGESGAQENAGGESTNSSSNKSKNGNQKQSERSSSSPSANSNPDKDAFERIQEFMKEKNGSTDADPSEGSQNPDSKNNKSDRGSESMNSDSLNPDSSGGDQSSPSREGSLQTGGDKTGGEKTGGEKTGGEKTGGEKTGGEKTGGEKTGGEKTGGEKTGGEKSGGEKTVGEKSGGEKSGGEKSGGEKSGGEKSGGDETGGKKPTQAPDVQSNRNPDDRKGDKSKQEQGGGQGSGNDEGGKDGKPQMSEPNSAGSGMNNTGRAPKSGGSGENKASEGGEFGSDKAKIDYANQATDMMLEYIDRQKDQPDPELLKRLDWSADDLRLFAEKWKRAKEEARKDPSKRAELEEALRNLGLSGAGQKVNRLKDRDDGLRGMREEGGRLRPPESLREQFEAFRKAAGRIGK